jgi:predicted nuclease of predicted toxin-antitoxin system
MARKRVSLDEQLGPELAGAFGAKAYVYTAIDFGVAGIEDPRVIDEAVHSKCLIVTANKDFVDYYRKHPLRKGSKLRYFYGLIFLKPSKMLSRSS